MTQQTLIVAIVAAVIVVALAWLAWSVYRTQSLRRSFGPEYERVLKAVGDRRRAEVELEARRRRVQKLHLRGLADDERARYLESWREAEARFVDEPRQSVS